MIRPGETRYVPHATDVERVTVVCPGDGGRNFRRSLVEPYVVRVETGPDAGSEAVYPLRMLYLDPLAAAIVSAELAADAEK